MEEKKLAGLEPGAVFEYFEALCAIPHGSHNTKAISDFLVDFAKKQQIRYIQDESNNIILFADGTCGLEDHEPVVLQGHMDMVCEKDEGCSIDMDTQGLDLCHDNLCVFAKGTTLGGDDGIAVAYAMALIADRTIPHPPLEVIITVDEEIGMLGADVIDVSMLKGRKMINLDSEDEGIFTVACAGGATATISLNVNRKAVYGPCVRLCVDGLRGGHSGAEIHKNRANANKVMGEFMSRILKLMPLCLTSFSGGNKDNAIPYACQANVVAMGIGLERINEIATQLQAEIREQYDEPEASVQAYDVDALGGNSLTTEDTTRVVSLLCAVPNGVQSYSEDMPGLVETSLNLGIAKLGEKFTTTFSVRSSVNQKKEELLEQLKKLSDFYDGIYSQSGEYPAWEYCKNSVLRDTMVKTYSEMFGEEPKVLAIHAGWNVVYSAKNSPAWMLCPSDRRCMTFTPAGKSWRLPPPGVYGDSCVRFSANSKRSIAKGCLLQGSLFGVVFLQKCDMIGIPKGRNTDECRKYNESFLRHGLHPCGWTTGGKESSGISAAEGCRVWPGSSA